MLKTDRIKIDPTLSKILNALPQMACIALPTGEVDFYNNKWQQYTGIPSDQMPSKGWKNSVHKNDLQEIEKKFSHALKKGISFSLEMRLKKSDGHFRWHVIKATPIKNETDETGLWIIICTDIQDRKRSKEELQDIEYRYRTLIEESSVATGLYTGVELKIQYANDIMLGYWGKDESVIGKTLTEAIPEINGQPFIGLLQNVYKTGIPYVGKEEKADLVINGVLQSFYFDFTYKALRDKDGNIYGIHHMATDVTDRVTIRKKIQESEERFRLMVQGAPVAMLVLRGEEMIFEIVNDAMLVLAGRDKTIIGKPALEALPELETQPIWKILKNVYRTGESFFANELPVQIVKNGKTEEGYYTFSYTPLKEHGATVGIFQVATEVTMQVKARIAAEETAKKIETSVVERTKELAEANINLQRSNAELAQFAYIASHDLQEPLRKISTFSQMLEHSLSDINETSKKYLDKINSSTTRMAKLIRDVLVYSQLANQNEIYKMVDLQQIIELNKTDYELLIEQKKATVSCENLPAVEAIPLQMTQLFGNLLSNSLKYSKPGEKPVIQISSTPLMAKDALNYFDADPQMEYYKIDFKDNGIGFRQEYANRIFNIFQRLHGKTDFSGTGIGLAMCKKIAQNHNGDIFAQGNPGKGAVFTVILPARQNKT